ncbi:ABC transporter ATP-binding protein [Oceanobacillus jeddahense]|uniref:ABC transporter ATP-binding protein n=1 Tax=Oceanobacillus jeddahense TaxID=1462527 RepID=UPI001FCBF156|nr:ABC transporter ATP-binding protein [Oceanobacillus jeddahense]
MDNLIKDFGETRVLKNINLDIKEGEFFALLGPSGCGKTTTMRCVAGFESPTEGIIKIGDKKVNKVDPHRRNCGMVFQSYALFPHMNVFDNVAYSLNVKELKKSGILKKVGIYTRMLNSKLVKYNDEMKKKVYDILEYVELTEHAHKLTSELSGGQQQRVALARSLVMEPDVLLMDEPLSNLDQKLRHTMRNTIRRIQQDLNITTIFVTHDQEEAMSMADRVAVMQAGEIVQVGTPTDLYSNPNSPYIADFVGTSNIIPGEVVHKGDSYSVIQFGEQKIESKKKPEKDSVQIIIRPENINILKENTPNLKNVFDGVVEVATYLGNTVRYEVKVENQILIVDQNYEAGEGILEEGSKVRLSISSERVLLL